MRYIDAEIALKIVDNYAKTVTKDGMVVVDAIRDIVSAITPTADVVEVRHGEWKKSEHGGYVCSECDCWLEDYYGATPEMMNYCFNCGAKMDGERAENEKS